MPQNTVTVSPLHISALRGAMPPSNQTVTVSPSSGVIWATVYSPSRHAESICPLFMGLERLALGEYKINDLRLIFENDTRLLEQF